MKWFGPPEWADACTGDPVPVPAGSDCLWCSTPIEAHDRGFFMTAVTLGDDGKPKATEVVWHRECLIRSTIGSPAHQAGTCTCHGREPAPEQTPQQVRAEAITVWNRLLNPHNTAGDTP